MRVKRLRVRGFRNIGMRVNVKGTKSSARLCDSCIHGHVMKGQKESEERVLCKADYMDAPITITFSVAECNRHKPKNFVGLYELEKMALVITKDRKGQIGFVKWNKFQEENPSESELPVPKIFDGL